jgi:hypothetical protein
MVKIVVAKGRRVWNREKQRDAQEGEVLEVTEREAKILKFRGVALDAPPEAAPPPRPPPLPPQPALESKELQETPDEDTRRRTYRRRDLRPEE